MNEGRGTFMSNYEEHVRVKIPTGVQNACISGVFDLGLQETDYEGKKGHKHQCIVMFEIINPYLDPDEGHGNRSTLSKKYSSINFSTDGKYKSGLQKDLEKWGGIEFTEQQIKEGFDLFSIYGKSCTLVLSENGKYTNVDTITKRMPENPPIKPNREFGDAPDWVNKIVEKQVDPNEVYKDKPTQATKQPADYGYAKEESDEDDLPF